MGKETPSKQERAQGLFQSRIDRLQADRELMLIMESGGLRKFVSEEIARVVAPLIQIIALQQEALDTHQAEIAKLSATVTSLNERLDFWRE